MLVFSETHLGKDFFIYDIIKIFILLAVIFASFIRTYLPPEKTRRFLSRKHECTGNILASLIGIVTPFCTCSAIPLFLGFVEAGVPLGVTFSFLVASPMINEVALVLLLGTFGWQVALIYFLSGLLIAIFSGMIIGKLKMEKYVAEFVYKNKVHGLKEVPNKTRKERLDYAKKYTLDIIKKVWLFVIMESGSCLDSRLCSSIFLQPMPEATMVRRAFGNAHRHSALCQRGRNYPLVSVLTEKGVAMGTTLAFMMAVTGLSLPEFLILKKVMKTKLILIFAGIVGAGIIFTGYLFNIILD